MKKDFSRSLEMTTTANYLPVKIHIKEQPQVFGRFGAQWTPTIQVLDSNGTERYQFEGYLPPGDFLAQLQLGLAHSVFARQQWKDAEAAYNEILNTLPESDAAPEALYWRGVSQYKSSGDPTALQQTTEAFKARYAGSSWAKKASVWAK